ncbi:hypothetical protein GOP47_0009810 [Adiantum capillus-veneris]|uniref:ZZ-type domain-containing protein n=1 Tax=Adiantum capillus-veneris TaxID=13818 RepID=A0A9D4UXJ2_ADICA|nr:hypothetical protein GOP47_0009810 [Adiantum capillus-veneris]
MVQSLKIKYGETFHRIRFPPRMFNYDDLVLKIRDRFEIPSTFRVILTYRDGEDDVITIFDNEDLRDACCLGGFDVLRIEVKTVLSQMGVEANGNESDFNTTESKAKGNASELNTTEFNVEALLKGLFPESTAKAIDQVLLRYPPCLFATVPAHVLPEALDTFLGTLAAGNAENEKKLPRGDQVIAPGMAVHKYIECDNCFVCPIVGPRYKSITKDDYDLCSNCVNKVGNPMDYRKLDRPLIVVPPNLDASLKGANDQCSFTSPCRILSSRGPFGRVSPKPDCVFKDLKGIESPLDAEFVKDVTILDGSKVEVDSTFTKVWRLRNCGAHPWPEHTKLIHIGGNMLGSGGFVTLKLPEGGLPFESELDVSVELKAPKRTGQYLANWRLRAPSGQMFGHSVWVLIEAIPDCNKSQKCEESQADKELKASVSEEAKRADSLVNDVNEGEEAKKTEFGLGKASMLSERYEETDGFSLVESVDNGTGEECEATEEFELVGLLAHKLDIKQDDVNIESSQNSFPEDDSLASTEWDHMVRELEELGFHDTHTSMKELLLKSEGSIKRAVKELVELETQTPGKVKAA